MAVVYETYEKDGELRVIARSDAGLMIERDGRRYCSADDYQSQERRYAETDIPIADESEEAERD